MLAGENSALSFYAQLSGRASRSNRRSDSAMAQAAAHKPQDLICRALAEMVPSTAEEIAEATGVDPATVQACLDQMTARYSVMFNPLTKRFSLPKAWNTLGRFAA